VQHLLGAGGELDAGHASIGVVCDDESVVAGGTGHGSAISQLLLGLDWRHTHDGQQGRGSGPSLLRTQSSQLKGQNS